MADDSNNKNWPDTWAKWAIRLPKIDMPPAPELEQMVPNTPGRDELLEGMTTEERERWFKTIDSDKPVKFGLTSSES